jgi:hypothetical protein
MVCWVAFRGRRWDGSETSCRRRAGSRWACHPPAPGRGLTQQRLCDAPNLWWDARVNEEFGSGVCCPSSAPMWSGRVKGARSSCLLAAGRVMRRPGVSTISISSIPSRRLAADDWSASRMLREMPCTMAAWVLDLRAGRSRARQRGGAGPQWRDANGAGRWLAATTPLAPPVRREVVIVPLDPGYRTSSRPAARCGPWGTSPRVCNAHRARITVTTPKIQAFQEPSLTPV